MCKVWKEVPPTRPAIQATVRFSAWPRRSTSTTEGSIHPPTHTPRITQPGTKYRCHLAMWPWPSHLPSPESQLPHNKMRERDVTHTVMEPFCWVPILRETQKHHLTLNPAPRKLWILLFKDPMSLGKCLGLAGKNIRAWVQESTEGWRCNKRWMLRTKRKVSGRLNSTDRTVFPKCPREVKEWGKPRQSVPGN